MKRSYRKRPLLGDKKLSFRKVIDLTQSTSTSPWISKLRKPVRSLWEDLATLRDELSAAEEKERQKEANDKRECAELVSSIETIEEEPDASERQSVPVREWRPTMEQSQFGQSSQGEAKEWDTMSF
jgi:hypothetical protein